MANSRPDFKLFEGDVQVSVWLSPNGKDISRMVTEVRYRNNPSDPWKFRNYFASTAEVAAGMALQQTAYNRVLTARCS